MFEINKGGTIVIPLKIETLLEGQVVEKNRVEYKKGWNPASIIHTICAFANDYSNVNGGYLVIGVEENNGMPILPPIGILKEQLDIIQKEIFQYCNLIEPRYIPMIEVIDYQDTDTYLIYLKCSPGDAGPYQAPREVYSNKKLDGKADRTLKYWIRPASLTVIAKQNEIAELFEKFNSISFDDRENRRAKLEIIRRGYLEDFLRDSKSSLVGELNNRSLEDLLLSLEVATETDRELALRNIAVLMFADRPDKLIPGAQIDLVRFNSEEAEGSDDFFEKTFTGPIWKQTLDVLDYIKTNVIEKKVVKIQGQAKAESFFNYPINALEEALVNAVLHKSYRDPEPVEVRIYVDHIMIINYPGPEKWIDMEKFAVGKVRSRKYRNRRIGEFFKEIELSEKQSTGITKILREVKLNGSQNPKFETDESRVYLITTFKMREGFDQIEKSPKSFSSISKPQGDALDDALEKTLIVIREKPTITQAEMVEILGNSRATIQRVVKKLVDEGTLIREGGKRHGYWVINEK
jgi:ATP-dependent DNA helicase RecG